MRGNIIFVGGIHGVGKTTICNEISDELEIKSYSSSELIKKINSDKLWDNKKVKNVSGNQNILLDAINLYLCGNKNYLLDGHFCLMNEHGEVNKVPFETFEKMKLDKIILVIDEASNIIKRLKSRDDNIYSLDFINAFQDQEIEYAKEVSKKLNKEILIVDYKNRNKIYELLLELKKSS